MAQSNQDRSPGENGPDESNRERPATGIRLGSIWVTYIESYHEASKKLQPATPRLAYPLLYLQRHTLELLTKDVLRALLAIREERHALDMLFGTIDGTGPVDPGDVDVANSTHRFSEIFPCLERNLSALDLPRLPDAFNQARKLFDDVDDERPDRLRFDTIFNKKQRSAKPSFSHDFDEGRATYAPCAQIATLLDQIVSARSRQLENPVSSPQFDDDADLERFYWEFWQACRVAEYDVVSGLGPLVEATRTDNLVWRQTSSPTLRVQEHPELKPLASDMFDEYLEGNFQGRTFVIVILRDLITVGAGPTARKENGFYLAARRANGTLTSGVWPDDSQSNLLYEIQQAFKRTRGA